MSQNLRVTSKVDSSNNLAFVDRDDATKVALTLKASGLAEIAQYSATQDTHNYAGGVVPTATTSGTDTFGIATVIWVSEVFIPANSLITGVSYLIGSVGGTDKAIAVLYDAAGNVVANSDTAGTTVGTTATMQRLAFVTAYAAKGPGLYYIGISTNGTTAKIRTQVFGDHNCGQITAQTFGTLVAITPPTTFTASQGPIAMTY